MAITTWEKYNYCSIITKVILHGEKKKGRNGITRSIFGETMRFDMPSMGFPVISGRKLYYKAALGEFTAFLNGAKTIDEFKKYGCNYWDRWADSTGGLNIDYGVVWRNTYGFNQLNYVRDKLKNDINSRRILIDTWRPEKLRNLSIPCCHFLYQWYIRDKNILDMIWYQRSVDLMLGFPYDMVLAALWNILLANEVNMTPGRLTFMLGDVHIYEEHFDNVTKYINNVRENNFNIVEYELDKTATVDNFTPDMLVLKNYNPLESIKFILKE